MKNLGLLSLSLTFLFCFSLAIYSQAEDVEPQAIVWQDPIMEKAIDGYMEYLQKIAEETVDEEGYKFWRGMEKQLREDREHLEDIVNNNLLPAYLETISQISFEKKGDKYFVKFETVLYFV